MSDKDNTFFADYTKLIKEIGAVEKAGESHHGSHMILADVLIASKHACNKCNFIVLQSVKGKVLNTILRHISGEVFESDMDLLLPSNDMQKYGSAITYARRYSLVTMLEISDKDDDGNIAIEPPKPVDKPKPTLSTEQTIEIKRVATEIAGLGRAEFDKHYDLQDALTRAYLRSIKSELFPAKKADALTESIAKGEG